MNEFKTTLFDQDYVTARYGDERERIGMKEGMKKTAVCLLQKGMSLQFITEVTGLTEDEIKALTKDPD